MLVLLHNTPQNRMALSIGSIMLVKGIYHNQNGDKTTLPKFDGFGGLSVFRLIDPRKP